MVSNCLIYSFIHSKSTAPWPESVLANLGVMTTAATVESGTKRCWLTIEKLPPAFISPFILSIST